MIFSSFRFLIFFPIVLLFFYASKRRRYRQCVLLAASYVFYASWDPRFLSLILFSTVVDYYVGLRIPKATTQGRRRGWLTVSLCANLGLLGFFKYANFFVGTFHSFLSGIGFQVDPVVLNIILPVGISFYTFQTMSYSIDIYRGNIEPSRDFIEFALFVAFFPQLVAGPIVRAVELLPQIRRGVTNRWDDVLYGIYRFSIGFTKKILIADNISSSVDPIFQNPSQFDSASLWIGTLGFSIQIYCDFSGYSDMAIGSGRIMGFRLPENFRFPLTALNFMDFWRRWHITLYSFMRDYLYFALGGSRVRTARLLFNVLLTMTLVGFWHGANWQFIIWGFYNGALLVFYRIFSLGAGKIPGYKRFLETIPGKIIQVLCTNWLLLLGMIFFRNRNVEIAFESMVRMFTFDGNGERLLDPWIPVCYVVLLLANLACELDWPRKLAKWSPAWLKLVAFALLLLILVIFGAHDTQAFVYFQF